MNFSQFIPLSQVLNDFDEVESLLAVYGEVIVVVNDRPKYRISAITKSAEKLPQSSLQSVHTEQKKGVSTMDILNKIGKSTFIEHYYEFKNSLIQPDDLPENFTLNSKRSRTSKARKIFRDGLQLDALQIIINSGRLEQDVIDKAKQIYEKEIAKT